MKHTLNRMLMALVLTLALPALAQALTFDDLRPDIPPCKQTKAKRPRLPADKEVIVPKEDTLRYDLNGDGWCDYAVVVGYPYNSQMNSYYINEMMLLGSKTKWMPVLHGQEPWRLRIDYGRQFADTYAIDNIDLTQAHLIYPKAGGAPYVLGLKASGIIFLYAPNPYAPNPICQEYSTGTVFRWDDTVGTFRRVDTDTARVVIDYFYERVAPPCDPIERCKYNPECSGRGFRTTSPAPSTGK